MENKGLTEPTPAAASRATGTLYMLPVAISDAPVDAALPQLNLDVMRRLRHFIVEDLRSARRFLRRCDRTFPIDDCTFAELNEHTRRADVNSMLEPLRRGEDVGVMSEAGCPGVADPGADVVAEAQREGLRVVPLVGPSSILMALMASGFNGQRFTFHGYLPATESARAHALRELEADSRRSATTHIFIETPYRNNQMLRSCMLSLASGTMLCIASAITDPAHESIRTLPVRQWKHSGCELAKVPTIFLIHVVK